MQTAKEFILSELPHFRTNDSGTLYLQHLEKLLTKFAAALQDSTPPIHEQDAEQFKLDKALRSLSKVLGSPALIAKGDETIASELVKLAAARLSSVEAERNSAQSALCDYTDLLQNARDRAEAAEAERDAVQTVVRTRIEAAATWKSRAAAAEAERDAFIESAKSQGESKNNAIAAYESVLAELSRVKQALAEIKEIAEWTTVEEAATNANGILDDIVSKADRALAGAVAAPEQDEQFADMATDTQYQAEAAKLTPPEDYWKQQFEQQKEKRMVINLDDDCIATIKRLTPEKGGEEIPFGGNMGGVILRWNPGWKDDAGSPPTQPPTHDCDSDYGDACNCEANAAQPPTGAKLMDDIDLIVEWEDDDEKLGVQKVTITAVTEQAAIDLEQELPRIKKILERDWNEGQAPEGD
jgi:hypothetical protein